MKTLKIIILLIISSAISTFAQLSYNFYFGNIHAHSSYSDGNKDSLTSMITTPFQDFTYAKTSQHIDFYGISEHNHLSAGMLAPSHYHKGIRDANAITVNGNFVALYGMEWGEISGGGHVIVYGYDSLLLGWDAYDYDVYVAKNDYANLWRKINAKPGAFAYLAHPQSTDYNNLFTTAYNYEADSAIVGLAARSGPAFSTNTTYSNPSTNDYIIRYNAALKQGYRLGAGLDHDTHNSVFGCSTAGRLVVLATSLTQANILDAVRNMRFYSSDDWNAKVNFSIASQLMGTIMTHAGNPNITASVTDADGESVSKIEVYGGVPGSGINPTILHTTINSSSLSFTHSISNNSKYYYYLKITQGDGDIIWTSPIWYTRNDATTINPPVASFILADTTVCAGRTVSLTDNSINAPATWNWIIEGATPNFTTVQNPAVVYSLAGTYTASLVASNSAGKSIPTSQTINVLDCATAIKPINKNDVVIYPNPAQDFLIIDFAGLIGLKNIAVYNTLGVKVLDHVSSANKTELNLITINSGMYTITIRTNQSEEIVKSILVKK